MKLEEAKPGLVHVEYVTGEDLGVESQRPLLDRLEEKRGPIVVIFEVGPAVRSVPMNVPTFWLGVTSRDELQLVGMAIVTTSAAVRVAARGFALANVARRIATAVKTFDDVPAAAAWGRSLLDGKPSP